MAYNTNSRKKKMIQALEDCYGLVSNACKIVGISRVTHYKWLKTDPKYKSDAEATKEVAHDFVEGQLLKQIRDNIPASTIFYCKTQLKYRGYIERTEITGANGLPIQISQITGMEIK